MCNFYCQHAITHSFSSITYGQAGRAKSTAVLVSCLRK